MSQLSAFEKIDKALQRYYVSLGRGNDYLNAKGTGKFLAFCDDNEYDEDDIDEELEDPENCGYLDFDEDFPFPPQHNNKHASEKQKFICNLIKECHKNPNKTFRAIKQPQTKPIKQSKRKPQPAPNKKATTKKKHQIKKSHNDDDDDKKLAYNYNDNKPQRLDRNAAVDATCAALKKYYRSINKSYYYLFSEYCYDNDIDLLAELDEGTESAIIDFDPNFPFLHELYHINSREKREFKFDLIKKCYDEPDRVFDRKLPQCYLSNSTLKYLYTITENEYIETRTLYKLQCPTLWNSGMATDKSFTYAIAIGRKYKFDYLQLLVDDYQRGRVRNIDIKQTAINIEEWCLDHAHFSKLKNIKFIAPWRCDEAATLEARNNFNNKPTDKWRELREEKKGPQDAYDIAVGALKSYDKRCGPKLQFKNLKTVNDSYENIVRYFDAAIGFVRGRLQAAKTRQQPICPFQVDFCIAFGAPHKEEDIVRNVGHGIGRQENDDDDDDDDDDVKQEKKMDFVDAVGNIEEKLKHNKLKYTLGKQVEVKPFEFRSARGLSNIYDQFIDEHGLLRDRPKTKDGGGDKGPKMYLHHKRLIVFVDRRPETLNKKLKQDEGCDDIWIYEPPINCRTIPEDAVSEWYISASKTSLLPNMDYGDGKKAEHQDVDVDIEEEEDKKDNENDKDKEKEKIEKANISSSFHCKGAVMTLSFIGKESDSIKCYLYWNGQSCRFMPRDVKTVLPKIINMKWSDEIDGMMMGLSTNERFAAYKDDSAAPEPDDIDAIVKRMQENMRDIYVEHSSM